MNALLHGFGHLFELAGAFVILLFAAWALVTLGVLSDSGYLLHMEHKSAHASKRRRPALRLVARNRSEEQRAKTA
jgi:hypothetical protein